MLPFCALLNLFLWVFLWFLPISHQKCLVFLIRVKTFNKKNHGVWPARLHYIFLALFLTNPQLSGFIFGCPSIHASWHHTLLFVFSVLFFFLCQFLRSLFDCALRVCTQPHLRYFLLEYTYSTKCFYFVYFVFYYLSVNW